MCWGFGYPRLRAVVFNVHIRTSERILAISTFVKKQSTKRATNAVCPVDTRIKNITGFPDLFDSLEPRVMRSFKPLCIRRDSTTAFVLTIPTYVNHVRVLQDVHSIALMTHPSVEETRVAYWLVFVRDI